MTKKKKEQINIYCRVDSGQYIKLMHSTEYAKITRKSLNAINKKRSRNEDMPTHVFIKGGYYFLSTSVLNKLEKDIVDKIRMDEISNELEEIMRDKK